MHRALPIRLVLALLLCVRAAADVEAQSYASAAGEVIDAATGLPVSDALLRLERLGAPGQWQQYTDDYGTFRFATLPAGRYRLSAERTGYRSFAAAVELEPARPLLLSVGLRIEPVPLPPLRLRATRTQRFLRREPAGARDLAPGGSQFPHLTLSTDARDVTESDVIDAITLAGPDLFRALQRRPGVATRSGYTAELWLRGAPWHETQVQFDGVPLYGPLHALGTLSALPTASIGALRLEPGIRSAAIGDAASGSVLVDTRRAEGAGELRGVVDLSVLSAALTLDQRVADARAGWLVSARRSYLDWLTAAVADELPYHFWDVTTRADARVGEHTELEGSALLQRDRLTDQARSTAGWGAEAARLTLASRLADLAVRHTVAFSRSALQVTDTVTLNPAFDSLLVLPARATGAIRYAAITGEWRPADGLGRLPRWAFGYSASWQDVDFRGLPPLPLPRPSSLVPVEEDLPDGNFRLAGTQRLAALWGERTLRLARAALQLGLRMEAGSRIASTPAVRASPRLSARLRASEQVTVSAAVGRTYQYVHALAPTGVHMASLSASNVWIVAGPEVPPLRADAASLGVHATLPAAGIEAAVHGFARHTTGVVMPPPAPGPLYARPLYVIGRGDAAGLEVEVRRVGEPVTGSVAYTFTQARLDAEGLRFSSPAERPHQLDLTAAVQLLPGLRLGTAFTAASGTPYTLVTPPCLQDCSSEPASWTGFPNALRAPVAVSLDFQLLWEGRAGGTALQAYAQLHNALGRDNGTFYTATRAGCYASYCGPRAYAETRYEPGLPRLPVIGVRLAF